MKELFDQVKHVIAEDDTALVYSTRDGVVCCSAHIPRAKRILAEHLERVLGVYDMGAKDQWIKDDLKWLASR